MADLVVVVPSRGRPEAARALAAAFAKTCTADTQLVFALDDDDPVLGAYPGSARVFTGLGIGAFIGPTKSMVEALNFAALATATIDEPDEPPFAVGFMGDDHRPRSKGWDVAYLDALRALGTGIVYGDDLLQGQNLATQCAMTSDIVRALGYMAPPTLTHLYVDNFWMSLGAGADCIKYLPNVVVEHMHPAAGKAKWDANYSRVNDTSMYAKDEAAFRAYVESGQLSVDTAKVRALRAAHV